MASEPRALIQQFALLMEAKLSRNDHKPGWRDESLFVHVQHLRDEVNELTDALLGSLVDGDPLEGVAEEACDVALMALIIWDWACNPMEHDGRGGVDDDAPSPLPCGCHRLPPLACAAARAHANPFAPWEGPVCDCPCHSGGVVAESEAPHAD